MQVFIIGSPFETAKSLSKRHLFNQVNEAKIIINAICGNTKGWKNHPCTIQYKNNVEWLNLYYKCLKYYKDYLLSTNEEFLERSKDYSILADCLRPKFHTEDFLINMKSRLYTKDPNTYSKWMEYGESYENWYCINDLIVKYKTQKNKK